MTCDACGRDMDRGEPHTAECASALAQDAADSGGLLVDYLTRLAVRRATPDECRASIGKGREGERGLLRVGDRYCYVVEDAAWSRPLPGGA